MNRLGENEFEDSAVVAYKSEPLAIPMRVENTNQFVIADGSIWRGESDVVDGR